MTPAVPCATVASIEAPHAVRSHSMAPLSPQELAIQARVGAAFGLDPRSAQQYSLLCRVEHVSARAGCLLTDLLAAAHRLRAARERLQAAQRELVAAHAYARCIGVMLAAWTDASCVRRRWHDSECALALARLQAAADGAALALLNERADALLADALHAGLMGGALTRPEPRTPS